MNDDEESNESSFPADIESHPPDYRVKNIFILHDKYIFNVNDSEPLQWGTSESQLIRPTTQGSGVMVTKFITENVAIYN